MKTDAERMLAALAPSPLPPLTSIQGLRALLSGVTPHPAGGFSPFVGYLPKTGKHARGHRSVRGKASVR